MERQYGKRVSRIVRKYRQAITYCFFGGIAAIINLCLFSLLYNQFRVPVLAANAAAWWGSLIFSFFANQKVVFKSAKGKSISQFLLFAASRLGTLGIEEAFIYLFATLLEFDVLIVKISTQVAVTVLNYSLSKFIMLRNTTDIGNRDSKRNSIPLLSEEKTRRTRNENGK